METEQVVTVKVSDLIEAFAVNQALDASLEEMIAQRAKLRESVAKNGIASDIRRIDTLGAEISRVAAMIETREKLLAALGLTRAMVAQP
jgi:hypothetical protein